MEWIYDDQFLFLCQAVSVLQVNFFSFTLLVNLSIAFVSTIFPIHFSLKKTPLMVLLGCILLLCLIHMACVLILTINRMNEDLFAMEEISFKDRIEALNIALTVTLCAFIGTFVCGLILFLIIVIVISNSLSYLRDYEETPVTIVWNELLHDCNNTTIVLFLASLAFYGLEIPAFLCVYNIISLHWWILLCHCAVHLLIPLCHFPLCSQLQHPVDRRRDRICRSGLRDRPNRHYTMMDDDDDDDGY